MGIVTHISDTTLIEAKSKLMNRPSRSKGKLYDKYFVYIPSEVARDSNFPFKSGDEVIVRIDTENKCLIIKKHTEKS
ncbi:MAG: hypothetical protein WA102_08690 [Candidatus Methanoperedens sp.]|nr:hypothetical protein [Candidatus Methanoperedens sp.]